MIEIEFEFEVDFDVEKPKKKKEFVPSSVIAIVFECEATTEAAEGIDFEVKVVFEVKEKMMIETHSSCHKIVELFLHHPHHHHYHFLLKLKTSTILHQNKEILLWITNISFNIIKNWMYHNLIDVKRRNRIGRR